MGRLRASRGKREQKTQKASINENDLLSPIRSSAIKANQIN